MEEIVKGFYSYFYQALYGKKQNWNKQSQKYLSNFVLLLDKEFGIESIGNNWIFEYISYQFWYWNEKETKLSIQVNWILGKDALEKFQNRKTGCKFYVSQFLIDKKLNIDFIVKEQNQFSQEEEYKKQFHNKGCLGLVNCIEFTTLFNPNSESCKSCNFQIECKDLLKSNYIKLYLKRKI